MTKQLDVSRIWKAVYATSGRCHLLKLLILNTVSHGVKHVTSCKAVPATSILLLELHNALLISQQSLQPPKYWSEYRKPHPPLSMLSALIPLCWSLRGGGTTHHSIAMYRGRIEAYLKSLALDLAGQSLVQLPILSRLTRIHWPAPVPVFDHSGL